MFLIWLSDMAGYWELLNNHKGHFNAQLGFYCSKPVVLRSSASEPLAVGVSEGNEGNAGFNKPSKGFSDRFRFANHCSWEKEKRLSSRTWDGITKIPFSKSVCKICLRHKPKLANNKLHVLLGQIFHLHQMFLPNLCGWLHSPWEEQLRCLKMKLFGKLQLLFKELQG